MGFHEKPTTHIGNVIIKVMDLERSLAFYQDIIGFRVLERSENCAKLTVDGKTSFLELIQPDDVVPKRRGTTGLYHFALLLPSEKDLANIVVHLSQHRVYFGASDHLVSQALYLQDIDGNEIEIYCDRPATTWTWRDEEVNMATLPLDFERLLKHATPNEPWDKLPEETVMGHIHLHVAELKETEKFYVQGLGMDLVLRFGAQALFLSYGKYHHHVGVNTWNGVGAPRPPKNGVGLESFSLVFNDENTRAETVNNLQVIGATVEAEGDDIVTYDPSGNKIILTV